MPIPSDSQIRHCHNFHHEASPAGEMLRALAVAGLRVVLLPCEPCSLPLVEHVVDKIGTQSGVQGCGAGLVRRGRSNGDVLYKRN